MTLNYPGKKEELMASIIFTFAKRLISTPQAVFLTSPDLRTHKNKTIITNEPDLVWERSEIAIRGSISWDR